MISRFTMTGILLATIGFSGLLLACGGEDAPEAPSAPAAQSQPAPEVHKSAEPVMPPIPSARPSNVEAELAVKIEMPDFYPADAPVFPGTAPSKVFVEGDKINIMFGSQDSVEDVLGFLNEELPRLGWDNHLVQRMSNIVTLEGRKGDRDLTIVLTHFSGDQENPTLIAIVVSAD